MVLDPAERAQSDGQRDDAALVVCPVLGDRLRARADGLDGHGDRDVVLAAPLPDLAHVGAIVGQHHRRLSQTDSFLLDEIRKAELGVGSLGLETRPDLLEHGEEAGIVRSLR